MTNELVKEIIELCELVDKFAKSDVTPGTPLYNFQQGMIQNVHRFRKENHIESTYQAYKMAKKLVENTEKCCEKNHDDEPLFKEWKHAITIFDSLGRGYAERYAKEKENEQDTV